MKAPIQTAIDGKAIALYPSGQAGAPIVYASMYAEASLPILEECAKLGCAPFHFVSVTDLRWDEELSPWPHTPVVTKEDHFTGEADGYRRCLTDRIVPWAEGQVGQPSCRVIAGYSMGGLFALYAPYGTDLFSRVVAASASVWYPDFVPFVRSHRFAKRPEAIYLSLGDQESRVKNPCLRQTERCMRDLHAAYQAMDIRTTFEINPGNHYQDAPRRMAKGIAWALG